MDSVRRTWIPCPWVFKDGSCRADGSGGDSCDHSPTMCRDVHRNLENFGGVLCRLDLIERRYRGSPFEAPDFSNSTRQYGDIQISPDNLHFKSDRELLMEIHGMLKKLAEKKDG